MSDVIKIVHIPRFRSTRPVWMYYELKELYGSKLPDLEITTFTDIPSFRLNKPQWLLDMNPNGKVPTMAHGDIVLFEGGAICSYLLDLYDQDRILLSKDPKIMSMYYLIVSWCASTLDNLIATSSPINIILDPTVAATTRPMDNVIINQTYFNTIFIPYFLKEYKKNGGPYLCGREFTAVDVIIGYFLLLAKEKMNPTWIEETDEVYSEIVAYIELLKTRPAMQKAITAANCTTTTSTTTTTTTSC